MVDEPSPTRLTALETLITDVVGKRARRYVGLVAGALVGQQRAVVGFGRRRTPEPGADTAEDGQEPDGAASFQIGSITKVFTALLLADAVERGEVDLDQPLDSIIPAVASHPQGRPITLRDLATHSAGLPRIPPGLREQAWRHRDDPYARFTTAQLREALAHPPPRPPGQRVRYSNYGAGVLGEALSGVAGRPFGELVATRITEPLGMADTGIDPPSEPGRRAHGHSRRRKPVVDWRFPALAGAGALRSTADDLLVFLDAHLHPSGTLLRAALQQVRERQRSAGRHLDVALGWHVLERRDGTPWWWHNGGTGGFFSFVGFDPVADVAVAVLTNTARTVDPLGAGLLQRLTDRVAS